MPLVGTDCPEACMGRLALQSAPVSQHYPEGIMVQVCRNPEKAGSYPDLTDYCGNGADVMTFYQTTPATIQQIEDVMNDW